MLQATPKVSADTPKVEGLPIAPASPAVVQPPAKSPAPPLSPPSAPPSNWLARMWSRRPGGWMWELGGLAVVAILMWFFGATLVFGPLVQAKALQRMDFVQTLVASGHVETPFRISVSSLVAGIVTSIPVIEGQLVHAGDLLVLLDDKEAQASLVQAQGQVAQAQARTRQIRELTLPSAETAVSEAQATLLNAQQSWDRASSLAQSGAGTRVTLDAATKDIGLARAQLRNAELTVYTNRPEGSDAVLAQTQLEQAVSNLAVVQARLGYTRVSAARDGILILRSVEVGDVVQSGKELMQLSPAGDAQLIVQIDEKNLGLVALGQSALASADAYSSERLQAKIVFINPGIDILRSSVEVKLGVAQPPPYLKADMTVSVDIKVARHPDALIVQKSDVHDAATAKPYVLKYQDGHALAQPVRIGLASDSRVEVLSGLAPGDIVLPMASGVAKGQRVRIAAEELPKP